MPPHLSRRSRRIPALIVILIACLLPYWNALRNAFTYYNHNVVEANELV